MLPRKLLVRLAVRLQDAWQAKDAHACTSPRQVFQNLLAAERCFHHARKRWSMVQARGWLVALAQLHEDLLHRIGVLQLASNQVQEFLERPTPAGPSLPTFVAELREIEDEFGDIRVDWKRKSLVAVTEPITLRDVHLGAFEIQFRWGRLVEGANVYCFDIVALTPNPPAHNDRVTHPHVNNKQLCAGDASIPLKKALDQGRVADAFRLVRSVLSHYNPSSPHVPLDEWDGVECSDCGNYLSGEDIWKCDGCHRTLCSACESECQECSCIQCPACIKRCAVCAHVYCAKCLMGSSHSQRRCCGDCLKHCSACRSLVATDELAKDTERCPVCERKATHCCSTPTPTQEQEFSDEESSLVSAAQ